MRRTFSTWAWTQTFDLTSTELMWRIPRGLPRSCRKESRQRVYDKQKWVCNIFGETFPSKSNFPGETLAQSVTTWLLQSLHRWIVEIIKIRVHTVGKWTKQQFLFQQLRHIQQNDKKKLGTTKCDRFSLWYTLFLSLYLSFTRYLYFMIAVSVLYDAIFQNVGFQISWSQLRLLSRKKCRIKIILFLK